MSKIYTNIDGLRDMTAEEQAEYNLLKTSSSKLRIIEDIAIDRGVSFNKDDYSEEDYDNLLARDEQGNLTHSIWSKS
tara:strand:+ start:688 stop:918 length:231 start_codon:yes stop_codon:yes gene_type:complete